ncbi:hypothetical protein [Streptomyces sp. 3214.6]|uniref:hypothetical protein n=1 Tax=Streptomyces sp. 3214.6 TaxID=1882757 RepID=UPI00090B822C|nr:hypothetical protein [Streptomyces sp. 3214.6]SHH64140.1 hypothetical protein SAMN05444521_1236 [Streptomyces sp. 3214.6]
MRFVSVRVCAPPPCPRGPRRGTAPHLALRIRSAGRSYDVLARVGCTEPGPDRPMAGVDEHIAGVDEHVAVGVGPGPEARWPACADVLHERCPRPFAEAARRLGAITAAHPGCRLAAAPLTGGGWAVTEATSRRVVRLASQVPPDRALLASCLHAWLVAGHTLADIEDIRVLYDA